MAVSEASPYPLVVRYCGECTMPTEYCEYGGNYAKCKEWLKANHPEAYEEELEGIAHTIRDTPLHCHRLKSYTLLLLSAV